ncbi:Gfo/Idh/MocA family oxidoreductase [Arthrobacter sp. ISL-5]|uniref:Gfo/Idh/MocA family protein n=1 Tax=Arthrobacter sp. ISL-5 TaxID=2819111 RepID=UPI001BE57725|nr:Gfo/Idh/MocA family oxidoreductase [Arthrobacter sp. ISL-5]MBT2554080.1 Gfo/Idh/MocA family oxidoreductase [Arthrobacter sp. ISL-5]
MSTDAASSRIRTAVVGFGLSGSVFHAPLIAADQSYSLDVIATSDAGRQAAAVERYPGVKTVPDGDAVLALAADLDLVVLGTPPATHYPLAKAALEAGLDVVVDKPFAVTSAQGQELIGLAERLGRVLTVFQNRRWDGDFLTVKALLEGGSLGLVMRFESRFERWSPEVSKAWKAEATAADGGGVLFDLGTHLLDQALLLFGPGAVVHAELLARRPDEKVDDDCFLVVQHESGVQSHLWMNMLCAQQGPRYRVLGSEAGYTKHGVDPQEPYIVAGGGPLDEEYGVEDPKWAGQLGRDGHIDRLSTERGAYPEFYRILAAKISDGGTASSLPLPVGPAGPVEVLKLIEQARTLA